MFGIAMPGSDPLWAALAAYAPFECAGEDDDELLFTLTAGDFQPLPELEKAGDFNDDTARIVVSKNAGGGFLFRIAPPGGEVCCEIETIPGYRLASAMFHGGDKARYFGLNNALMLLYAFSSAKADTLLVHASVIKNNGKGFLFLGKSGTGKSTHSRLWLGHIPGSELLNDDNPVLRIVKGKVFVYGTPWSGKTPCYKNDVAEVGAIVRLQQKPENSITSNSAAQAFAVLKPSCSSAPWDKEAYSGILDTLTAMLQWVRTYTLGCRPDKDAAELCYRVIADERAIKQVARSSLVKGDM